MSSHHIPQAEKDLPQETSCVREGSQDPSVPAIVTPVEQERGDPSHASVLEADTALGSNDPAGTAPSGAASPERDIPESWVPYIAGLVLDSSDEEDAVVAGLKYLSELRRDVFLLGEHYEHEWQPAFIAGRKFIAEFVNAGLPVLPLPNMNAENEWDTLPAEFQTATLEPLSLLFRSVAEGNRALEEAVNDSDAWIFKEDFVFPTFRPELFVLAERALTAQMKLGSRDKIPDPLIFPYTPDGRDEGSYSPQGIVYLPRGWFLSHKKPSSSKERTLLSVIGLGGVARINLPTVDATAVTIQLSSGLSIAEARMALANEETLGDPADSPAVSVQISRHGHLAAFASSSMLEGLEHPARLCRETSSCRPENYVENVYRETELFEWRDPEPALSNSVRTLHVMVNDGMPQIPEFVDPFQSECFLCGTERVTLGSKVLWTYSSYVTERMTAAEAAKTHLATGSGGRVLKRIAEHVPDAVVAYRYQWSSVSNTHGIVPLYSRAAFQPASVRRTMNSFDPDLDHWFLVIRPDQVQALSNALSSSESDLDGSIPMSRLTETREILANIKVKAKALRRREEELRKDADDVRELRANLRKILDQASFQCAEHADNLSVDDFSFAESVTYSGHTLSVVTKPVTISYQDILVNNDRMLEVSLDREIAPSRSPSMESLTNEEFRQKFIRHLGRFCIRMNFVERSVIVDRLNAVIATEHPREFVALNGEVPSELSEEEVISRLKARGFSWASRLVSLDELSEDHEVNWRVFPHAARKARASACFGSYSGLSAFPKTDRESLITYFSTAFAFISQATDDITGIPALVLHFEGHPAPEGEGTTLSDIICGDRSLLRSTGEHGLSLFALYERGLKRRKNGAFRRSTDDQEDSNDDSDY